MRIIDYLSTHYFRAVEESDVRGQRRRRGPARRRHRCCALTNDATIVDELLAWLCRLLPRTMPTSAICSSARLLAEVLEPQTPAGATILGNAADKLETTSGAFPV